MIDNLPVYNIVFDEETNGLNYVSFVADPAIMEMGLAFFKTTQASFKFDKDKQVVIGPAMIAGLPLYREIGDEKFYVVFSKEVIEQLVEKFNKDSVNKKINVDHGDVVESAFIKSNWIKEDMKFDKSNLYGFENIPVGSWFVEVKVDDPVFWENEIKSGGKFGFSVEGIFGLSYQEFNKNKIKEMNIIETLTPKEIALIERFRFGNFDRSIFEEDPIGATASEGPIVVEADEEVIGATAGEGLLPVEAEEEIVVEEIDDTESKIDEEAIMALVQPKLDDIVAMIAEIKSMVESKDLPVDVVEVNASTDRRSEKIKLYRQKFSTND